MNLQETIAELEHQAAKYTQAANALRALLENEDSIEEAAPEQPVQVTSDPHQNGARARRSTRSKGTTKGATKGTKKAGLSAESRAKISESMRARHQQKREQQATSAGAPE